MIDPHFWNGKRVLVTGHTGFKGGWLCHWLAMMGAEVSGFALDPSEPNSMFAATAVGDIVNDHRGDVRDLQAIQASLAESQPEVIFHLAAQPLVRHSYAAPLETLSVNVMGTANLLEAVRTTDHVRAIVVVTSDKCYENRETGRRYRESDPLGGHDPYSASKACAELVTSAYRKSFFAHHRPAIATARAGNVIGGGDWAPERLVPDCLRAFAAGLPVSLRRPDAVRPWQHVLEPLSGYLRLAQALCTQPDQCGTAYNFGPSADQRRTVLDVVRAAAEAWGEGARWECSVVENLPHEAGTLDLDSSLAQRDLGWTPRWNLDQALQATMSWYREHRGQDPTRQSMLATTRRQLAEYLHSDYRESQDSLSHLQTTLAGGG